MGGGQKSGTLQRVLSATIHYGLASYLPKLINFVLLPIYAIYLKPEEMGILEVTLAIDVLMQSIARLGLPGALSRQYFDHKESLDDLFTSTAVGALVASAIFTAIALLAGPLIFVRWLPEVPFHPYLDIALIASFLRLAPELQSRLLQATEQSKLASSINVGVSLFASFAKLTFIVALGFGLLGALYAELAAAALAAIIAVARHTKELRGKFRWDLLKEGLIYGAPLVPHRFGAWLQEYGGRWVMTFLGVIASVGQLGLATRIVAPLQVAAGAFATAVAPVYFSWRKDLSEQDALKETRKTSAAALSAGAVMALGASSFGTVLLAHFLPSSYRPAAHAVGLLAAGMLIRVAYNILGMELLYSKRTGPVSIIFAVGSVVTIALTAILVPPFAVVGAAIAQLVGTTSSVAITAVLARRTFPTAIDARTMLAMFVSAAGSSAVPWLLPGFSAWTDLGAAAVLFAILAALTLLSAGVSPESLRKMAALRKRRVATEET